jgi:putative colanic acid biosynthesis UDP-glucose lipid carrier transferase
MNICGSLYEEVVPYYYTRHRVKPGITGLAQISGSRGEIDTVCKAERRLYFDLKYIDSWSIGLDLRIILTTIVAIVIGEDAY